MAPTTVTTIVLILLALGLLAMAGYSWFGSWEPAEHRLSPEQRLEREYQAAVREMRQAIERYERGGGR